MIPIGADLKSSRPPDRGRLLIFDDDETVGDVLAMFAERLGMETRAVTRFQPFVEGLEDWLPTHIVLDLIMPEIDGVQVMRLLAARDCQSMIILTSGIGGRILEAARRSAEAFGLNIAGVLPKPFDTDVLQTLLARPAPAPGAPSPGGVTSAAKVTRTALRGALKRREIELAYQPKVECSTGKVSGFEALARWRRPNGDVVMPDDFIPVAEGSELIDELTNQVSDQALLWLAGSGISPDLTVSFNISNRNLKDRTLADRLAAQCRELRLDPGRVILELTETSAMEDAVHSLALITRFRIQGFRLAIDDFGAGYSSMLQLVRLPVSELKIDKSFVVDAARSDESRTVIKSMVDLGRGLDLLLTAEGVEDAETLEFLAGIGCDLAQGYHIARPMRGDQVADWMSRR